MANDDPFVTGQADEFKVIDSDAIGKEPLDNFRAAALDETETENLKSAESGSALKIWQSVPDGAIFELRVGSQNPTAAAIARFVSKINQREAWPYPDLNPGPKRRQLRSAELGYAINVIIAFDGDHPGPVAVFARILVGGAVFETPYLFKTQGGRGDIKIAKILIDMA